MFTGALDAGAQDTALGSVESAPFKWVIDASHAKKLLAAGGVTVLDTRNKHAFNLAHVAGAVRVDWTGFSQPSDPHRGKLKQIAELQSAIRSVGVRADRPVFVIGSPPDDWGEDGRIVWMLRVAGHGQVALVDGGFRALVHAGVPTTSSVVVVERGDFEVRWDRSLAAVRDEVRDAPDTLVLDTREMREYRGSTPYGAARGGHVRGAKHLYFKDLMLQDGRLKTNTQIRERLAELGATTSTPIIAYCTGGVRSGWMVVVLRGAGFQDVRNYAGSMWDWAAAPAGLYPLVAP